MPELPEVRTVKSSLETKVIGKVISKVDVLYDKIVENKIDFQNKLINQEILSLNTKGKFIIFELSNFFLISHLRMEGKYYYYEKDLERKKHEHIVFHFSDNSVLIYHDVRKFGKMYIRNKEDLYTSYPLNKVALEPFDINESVLYEHIKTKQNTYIKTILLNQSVISGIGNIYADEILFLAKLSPFLKGKDITIIDCKNIIINSKTVLNKAIALGGTTLFTYSSMGIDGKFQNELLIHNNDKDCPICKEKVKKIKINGRTTYYCPNCQK